ncbi:MAG: protein kinase [Actinomycetota bacterium]
MVDREVLAGRYALGDVLGQGGMGTVYAARDLVLGREVAIKMLDVKNAPVDALDRFRHEGQFLAGLSHPNIVTIFDFGTDVDTAWLVMELLPGPTLDRLLTDEGPLPVERVISCGQQCAAALAAAHAAGITHRDVKPANLMLAADGRCVLVDLGIARLNGATTTQPALTGAGLILGTVAFVAPEIITGGAPGPQADLYALGAVMFILLTGRPPFAADTSAAIFAQHLHAPPPRPSSLRADTPAALDDLIVGLLDKNPDLRPDAGAVSTALAAPALGHGDVAALATSPRHHPQTATTAPEPARTRVLTTGAPVTLDPAVRRRRRGIAALVAAALVAAAAIAMVALLAHNNSVSGLTTSQPPTPALTQSSSPAARTPTPGASTSARGGPSTVAEAVSALRSAINSAAGSGALDPRQAQEAQGRLDKFNLELSTSKPEDLRKRVDDLDKDLTDYLRKGQLTSTGYGVLSGRVFDLRSTLTL